MSSTILLGDVSAFLDYVRLERGSAENTVSSYGRALVKFTQFVKGGGVSDYLRPQPAEVARYVESLHGRGLAPASRSLTVTALQQFYRRLVALGRMPRVAALPVLTLAKPKIPERLPNVLSVDAIRRLLDAPCRKHRMYWRDKSLLEFLYASGCRASEATELRMADLDLGEASARVQGKGDKERVVLLGAPAVQSLYGYIYLLRPELVQQQPEPSPLLFLSRAGLPLDRTYIFSLVNGYAERAGLPSWVGAHSLRHAAATHVIQGGADVRFAQELLGHSNASTTTIYLHLDVSHLRSVHEQFEQYRLQSEASLAASEAASPAASEEAMPSPPRLYNQQKWTAEQDEWVRALPIDEVIERTRRTRASVRNRRCDLGVTRKVEHPPRWTVEEESLLLRLPLHQAVERLGRTVAACIWRLWLLGRRNAVTPPPG